LRRDFKTKFLLDTDASGFGLGAVLSQIGPDNKEHVIAYFSKALTKPEVKVLFKQSNASWQSEVHRYKVFFSVKWWRGLAILEKS
jgi:hypothetical protein